MSATFLKQFMGSGAEATAKRAAFASSARKHLRERMSCAQLPAFLASVDNLVNNGYPSWFKAAFYSHTPVQY